MMLLITVLVLQMQFDHSCDVYKALGVRRSGVLPSHARRNGSLPIPCMGCLSHRCSVPS